MKNLHRSCYQICTKISKVFGTQYRKSPKLSHFAIRGTGLIKSILIKIAYQFDMKCKNNKSLNVII